VDVYVQHSVGIYGISYVVSVFIRQHDIYIYIYIYIYILQRESI
jgi:hypothetical protein